MQFEHFALNVPDAASMARWYIENCGLQAVMALEEPPHTHFLADSSGRVICEIYTNEAASTPEYAERDPLVFHWAFEPPDVDDTRESLVDAGAELVSDELLEDGSHLVMLRDPWGIPLQLVKRAKPFS
jgi:catechol 2,3-dioxygenase-like lactoylglutathione lyase family enzyme